MRRFVGALVLAAACAPSAAAPAEPCDALQRLITDARSDFPALGRRTFEGANCVGRSRTFRCGWSFSSDSFAAADAQVSRLVRCAAASPNVAILGKSRGKTSFQLSPETTLIVRGPSPDSGNWAIGLEIATTAEW